MRYQTDRSRVHGLGSAKTGTAHFWEQRISAIALVILTPLFVFPLAYNLGGSFDEVREAYAHPLNAIVAIAFIVTAMLHLYQGLQVVIEDYAGGRWELFLLIATRLMCSLFALTGVFAILKIAFTA
ncbi:succinate dehydrogenase, hydrophobic membrane anchor protein [Aliiroseovarius subalbicans]|uniref:succinate dehydrogenase, hydrophobic membrane anchor protein n=1 Tax=Aliiroseovarius subalbicans TaxID=2925840 RepID=UPI001F57ED5C|nr:succinate dehydrogenase, hydrophobic membrane anchor protein [Aliiroseovarius subalbicans]MCI2400653.1 succinate dehydrogenase, hydrophobic membrane anchor protein [Aliiroseovarius subalbicans]